MIVEEAPQKRRSDFVDLTGMRFGSWTVIRWSHQRAMPCGQRPDYWLCRCRCGTEKAVGGGSLVGGRNRGCRRCATARIATALQKKTKRHLGSRRFAVTLVSLRKNGRAGERPQFNARCDCGNSFVAHGLMERDCGCGIGHVVPPVFAAGKSMNMSAWAKLLGVSRQRVHQMKVRGDLEAQIARRLS